MTLQAILLQAARTTRMKGNAFHLEMCRQASFIEGVAAVGSPQNLANMFEALLKEAPEALSYDRTLN